MDVAIDSVVAHMFVIRVIIPRVSACAVWFSLGEESKAVFIPLTDPSWEGG